MSAHSQMLKRDSNIELLRIVLMGMIVLHHLIVHGCHLVDLLANEYSKTSNDLYYLLINSFAVVGVNTFVFISGYYGIKFKMKTFVSFIIQGLFYSVGIFLFFYAAEIFCYHQGILAYKVEWSNLEFAKSFFPILLAKWWFFSVYVGLYILSPLLNKGLMLLRKEQLLFIILVFVILDAMYLPMRGVLFGGTGNSIFSFVIIYLIAYFMHAYVKEIKYAAPFYVGVSLVSFACVYILFNHSTQSATWSLFSYSNPLLIVSAIFLFYTFKNLKLKHNRFINSLSPLILGVYLISDHGVTRALITMLVAWLNHQMGVTAPSLLVLFVLMLVILSVCMLIEKVRQLICAPLQNYLFETNIFKQVANKLDVTD